MKRIKTLIILVTTLLIALTITACMKSGEREKEPEIESRQVGAVYEFAYLSRGLDAQWCQDVAASYQSLSKKSGKFNITICDAQLDPEQQMNQLNEMISKGVDAVFIIPVDENTGGAMADICAEAGVLMIGESIPMMDTMGHWVCPMVQLDAVACGSQCAQWIYENAEACGFDTSDLNKIGFMVSGDSRNTTDVWRYEGAIQTWVDTYGIAPEDVYLADVAAATANDALQASNEQAATIIAAHPEKEAWFVVPVMEDDAVGCVRALEEAGFIDTGLVCSVGGERAVLAWPEGQGAPWLACSYFHGMFAAEIISNAAIDILDGKTTAEDVFPKESGQKYGSTTFSGTPCTIKDYQNIVVVLE